MKFVAVAYLVVVGLAAIWACYIDVSMLGSPREHLLPDSLLMVCGLPTSLLIMPVYIEWPDQSSGLTGTAFLAICAVAQSGLLVVLAFRGRRHTKV